MIVVLSGSEIAPGIRGETSVLRVVMTMISLFLLMTLRAVYVMPSRHPHHKVSWPQVIWFIILFYQLIKSDSFPPDDMKSSSSHIKRILLLFPFIVVMSKSAKSKVIIRCGTWWLGPHNNGAILSPWVKTIAAGGGGEEDSSGAFLPNHRHH